MSKYILSGLRGYPRAAVHPQQLLAGGGGGDEDLLHPAGESANDDKMVSCHCCTHPGGGESASGDVAPAAPAREENQSL